MDGFFALDGRAWPRWVWWSTLHLHPDLHLHQDGLPKACLAVVVRPLRSAWASTEREVVGVEVEVEDEVEGPGWTASLL